VAADRASTSQCRVRHHHSRPVVSRATVQFFAIGRRRHCWQCWRRQRWLRPGAAAATTVTLWTPTTAVWEGLLWPRDWLANPTKLKLRQPSDGTSCRTTFSGAERVIVAHVVRTSPCAVRTAALLYVWRRRPCCVSWAFVRRPIRKQKLTADHTSARTQACLQRLCSRSGTRTHGHQLKRLALYQAELSGRACALHCGSKGVSKDLGAIATSCRQRVGATTGEVLCEHSAQL
jgi:hypothetical protein